jgi:phytoene dehydrogenase-like protein
LLKLIFFSTHPDPEKYEQAVELSAEALGLTAPVLKQTDGISLLERLFESEQTRIFLIPLPALNLFGDLTVPGQGALSWLWAFLLRACIAPAGNQSLVFALERVFLQHGGTLLRNTEAQSFIVKGNECKGVLVKPYNGSGTETIVARKAVISNLGASLTSKLLGDTPLPEAFSRKVNTWSTAQRVLAVHDFILQREPRWKPGRHNPDFARSPRIYLVWNTWKECVAWLRGSYQEESTFHGDVEITLLYNIYDQSATGKYALRVRHGTGPYSRDLEQKRAPFTDTMLAQLADASEEIPRQIIAHHMSTPLDFWHANPVALHGNPVGGDFIEGQWMLDRCPYKTPVDHLYMSNSVWPTALSWLAPGYNAASVVAEELGVREQSWWSHEPGEWFMNALSQMSGKS